MVQKDIVIFCVLLSLLTGCTALRTTISDKGKGPSVAKNVIFMIVDGMGPEYIKAARIYNGNKPFIYEAFPCKTRVKTCSKESVGRGGNRCSFQPEDVTDSAAAATAMATGFKVKNGAISKDTSLVPADLLTILELMKKRGKSTGIVATKLFTDATPAAFVSHTDARASTKAILNDIFLRTVPTVIFGADTNLHRQVLKESKALYNIVHSASGLKELTRNLSKGKDCHQHNCPLVYGGFGEHELIPKVFEKRMGLPLEITAATEFLNRDVPHLSEMTEAALNILSKNKDGFFLMVESSMPDIIGHLHFDIDERKNAPNAVLVLIKEMFEVNNTVKVIDAFLAKNPNTLFVLTADHETGGLAVLDQKTTCIGEKNCQPQVMWKAGRNDKSMDYIARHTGVDVPLYAVGVGAERFCLEQIDNTDIPRFAIESSLLTKEVAENSRKIE